MEQYFNCFRQMKKDQIRLRTASKWFVILFINKQNERESNEICFFLNFLQSWNSINHRQIHSH